MADELCPTCHSKIKLEEEESFSRVRGSQNPGVDEPLPETILSADTDIVPFWSEDPVLTVNGFSGEDFVGTQRQFTKIIEEIQEVRKNEELEAGLPEENQTDFSEISGQRIRNTHINELRESIEKLLNTVGTTLKDYFTMDAEGNVVEVGPNDEEEKEDWTDVERGKSYIHKDGTVSGEFTLPDGTTEESPSLPNTTKIRAIHIEDLRRPILLNWREFWSASPAVIIETDSNQEITETTNTDDVDPPTVSSVSGVGLKNGPGLVTITSEKISEFLDDFDIKSSDAGNRYTEGDSDRSWLTDYNEVYNNQTSQRQIFALGSSFVNPGDTVDVNGEIKTGKNYGTETKVGKNVLTGFSTLTTETSVDSDVLALKSSARQLRYIYSRATEFTPSLSLTRPENILQKNNYTHLFKTVSEPTEGEIGPAFADRDIKIKKDTNFKFLLIQAVKGLRDARMIAPGGLDVLTFSASPQLATRPATGPTTVDGPYSLTGIVELNPALLLEDAADVAELRAPSASTLPDDIRATPQTIDIESAFNTNDIRIELILEEVQTGTERLIRFILGDNDSQFSLFTPAPITSSFGGETFLIGPGNSVYLGNGASTTSPDGDEEKTSTEFDIAINLDDYLTAKEENGAGTGYISQKLDDGEGNIIQNPDGTELVFKLVRLTITNETHFDESASLIDSLSSSGVSQPGDLAIRADFVPVESSEPSPGFGAHAIGTLAWYNYTEDGIITWDAIRIENNSNKVRT